MERGHGRPGRRDLQCLVHASTGGLLRGKTYVPQSGLAQREAEPLLRNQRKSKKSTRRPARHILSKVSDIFLYFYRIKLNY